ncbi:MAG: acetyl-CoA C-acyltransferase [Acidobacteria bacterium]|nr:acetyl-CoA C-acyltransferase [Acidobacteriota bacterium]
MTNEREVVVLSGVRTAIGRYGGSLKDKPLSDLSALVVKEAVARAGVKPADVGHVVFGNVIHTEPKDMYLGRVAAIKAGLPVETPAFNTNRLCGSGMQAIVSAAQVIRLGEADVAVAGGAESMSRGPYWMPSMRWGARMNDAQVLDAMVGALTDPFDGVHMALTCEDLAKKYGVSREEQIVPVEVKAKGATTFFDTDEHPRADVTREGLAKLKPVFDKNGQVTAGNAAGINDAASAVVLADRNTAEERGLKPLARLVAYSYAGVEPRYMGIGPVPAVRAVLAKAGLTLNDMDLIELNEAFAAQSVAVIRQLGLPEEKTNPNGGAVALGHPVGASGNILAVKAIYELQRTGMRYALVTMCIGGGQGIAAIFERI